MGENTRGAVYHDYVLCKERNGGKIHEVTLHEMIHIGPEKFYAYRDQQLEASYAKGHIIQIEGVKLPVGSSRSLSSVYQSFAELSGLTMQKKPNVPYVVADVEYEKLRWKDRMAFDMLSVLIKFASKSMANVMESERADELKNMLYDHVVHTDVNHEKSGILKVFSPTLLDTRNKHAVDIAVNTHENISMLWGKAHAKGIIELLEHQGYRLASKSSVFMADFV